MSENSRMQTIHRPGWLRRVLDEAVAEMATWPQRKREMMRDALAPPPPDPCRCKRRCDEAQTCVGGCAYDR